MLMHTLTSACVCHEYRHPDIHALARVLSHHCGQNRGIAKPTGDTGRLPSQITGGMIQLAWLVEPPPLSAWRLLLFMPYSSSPADTI